MVAFIGCYLGCCYDFRLFLVVNGDFETEMEIWKT